MAEYRSTFQTNTTSGYGLSWPTTVYLNGVPMAPAETPKKEIPMVAGAAPVKTLHTRYAQVKGGYVGQVVYGDPERTTSEGVIAWESLPFPFGGRGRRPRRRRRSVLADRPLLLRCRFLHRPMSRKAAL